MVSRRNYALDLMGAHSTDKTPAAHESRLNINVSTLVEAARQGDIGTVTKLFHVLVPQYDPMFQETREVVVKKKNGEVERVGLPFAFRRGSDTVV